MYLPFGPPYPSSVTSVPSVLHFFRSPRYNMQPVSTGACPSLASGRVSWRRRLPLNQGRPACRQFLLRRCRPRLRPVSFLALWGGRVRSARDPGLGRSRQQYPGESWAGPWPKQRSKKNSAKQARIKSETSAKNALHKYYT
jgi:hypothetical protein